MPYNFGGKLQGTCSRLQPVKVSFCCVSLESRSSPEHAHVRVIRRVPLVPLIRAVLDVGVMAEFVHPSWMPLRPGQISDDLLRKHVQRVLDDGVADAVDKLIPGDIVFCLRASTCGRDHDQFWNSNIHVLYGD